MAYRAYILLQSSRIDPPGLHSELLNSWHCVIITNTEFFTHSVWWNIITKPWDAWARNCLSNSILEISLQTKKILRIVLVVEVLPVAAAQIETRLCRSPKRPETNKPDEQVYDTLVPRQWEKGIKNEFPGKPISFNDCWLAYLLSNCKKSLVCWIDPLSDKMQSKQFVSQLLVAQDVIESPSI